MDLVRVKYKHSGAGVDFVRPKGYEEDLPRDVAERKEKQGAVEIIDSPKTTVKPKEVPKVEAKTAADIKAEIEQKEEPKEEQKKRGRKSSTTKAK